MAKHMSADKDPLTLFGLPIEEVIGPRFAGFDVSVGFREIPDPALADRAAFVRHHVSEILKKHKTSASHRTKGKKLLERCEAIGDTGAGEEARAEFEMAEASDALIEQHIAALITRTTRES